MLYAHFHMQIGCIRLVGSYIFYLALFHTQSVHTCDHILPSRCIFLSDRNNVTNLTFLNRHLQIDNRQTGQSTYAGLVNEHLRTTKNTIIHHVYVNHK